METKYPYDCFVVSSVFIPDLLINNLLVINFSFSIFLTSKTFLYNLCNVFQLEQLLFAVSTNCFLLLVCLSDR